MSNAFLKTTVGFVSAYGIASSAIERRWAIGRGPAPSPASNASSCSVSDSRGLKPMRTRHGPQVSARPSSCRLEPSRLGDLDRAQVVAVGAPAAVAVVAVLGRHRQHAVVVDPDDLHAVEIDDRDEAADRARVAVVAGQIAAQPGERTPDAPVRLLEAPDRPGVDHDRLEVVHAAQRERAPGSRDPP